MAVTSANANAPGPASPMGCPYRWAAIPIPMTTITITTIPTTTPLARGMSITIPPTPTPTTRSGPAPCASPPDSGPPCRVVRSPYSSGAADWRWTAPNRKKTGCFEEAHVSRPSPSLVGFGGISRSDRWNLSPFTGCFPQGLLGFSTANGSDGCFGRPAGECEELFILDLTGTGGALRSPLVFADASPRCPWILRVSPFLGLSLLALQRFDGSPLAVAYWLHQRSEDTARWVLNNSNLTQHPSSRHPRFPQFR